MTHPMKVTGFDDATTAAIGELLPDVALQFGDTIRLAARPQLGPTAGDATITEISPDGVRVDIEGSSTWIDFRAPIAGIDGLARATVDLAEAARDLHPDAPMTSLEVAMSGLDTQRLLRSQVLDVTRLSEHMAALRIGPFSHFESLGWDQSLSLLPMNDGRPVPDDLSLETWRSMPADESPRGRTYTVRSVVGGVLELWVALHGDDPETASSWCRTCEPGDPVAILGPRGRFMVPPPVERAMLIADESAFGAAAAVAEHLDPGIEITIVGVVENAGHHIDFDLPERIATHWLDASLDPHIRADTVIGHIDAIDADSTYFWGAGEFEMTRRLRRHLRRDRALPATRVAVSAYW
ncbi:MAG: siderophore-interacting protein, partial [Actinomycetota bacterium]